MHPQLSEADGYAVDLVLNTAMTQSNPRSRPGRVNGDSGGMPYAAPPVNEDLACRVPSVEKILEVLHAMPAPDPAPDLISRTLQRVEASRAAALHPEQPSQQPAAVR